MAIQPELLADQMSTHSQATEFQGKYEIFLVTLIFTILGLAVQTAKLIEVSRFAAISELASWCLLLSAGVLGVWRLQWIAPQLMRNMALNEKSASIDQLEQLLQSGHTEYVINGKNESVAPLKHKLKTEWDLLDAAFQRTNRFLRRGFFGHLLLFIAGLVGLMLARGFDMAAYLLRSF